MRNVRTMNTAITVMMFVMIIMSADAMLPVRPVHQSHNQSCNQVCGCGGPVMVLMTMAMVIVIKMHPISSNMLARL